MLQLRDRVRVFIPRTLGFCFHVQSLTLTGIGPSLESKSFSARYYLRLASSLLLAHKFGFRKHRCFPMMLSQMSSGLRSGQSLLGHPAETSNVAYFLAL